MDVETGDLTYANAGHTHPVFLGCVPSFLKPVPGIAIGLFEGTGLKDYVLPIKPGEGILLYTDGITEAVNPRNLFFGEERLLHALTDEAENNPGRAGDAEAVVQKVSDSVSAFCENGEPFDDAALLVLLRKDL